MSSIDRERFLSMVDKVMINRAWEVIPTDRPYGDVDTLFREELGVSYQEAIEAVTRREAIVQGRR